MANDTVLRIIPRKTVFSHKGDVAKAHNLYWVGTLEIYKYETEILWNEMRPWEYRAWWDEHWVRTQYNSSGSCPADNPGEKVEHILSRSIPNGNYLKIGLSFRLERDNHETDEDVDHEEGEDDDVDEVEHEDNGPIAFLWSHVSFVGVDGNVENPENIDR